MSIAVGTVIGKYRVRKHCGEGSFGTVYAADNLALGGICAIKLIEIKATSDVPALLEEAKNLRKCESKHIVEAKSADIVSHAGTTYLSIEMEYLPSGSIESKSKSYGLDFQSSLTATRHILFALSASHNAGVIHRDVKPGNVMIDGHDFKLTDFGISFLKTKAHLQENINYTMNAAPECKTQLADELCDVYSAGITLYRMTKFRGDLKIDPKAFAAWRDAGSIPSLPEYLGLPDYLPRRLKDVIKKSTNPDRAKRFQSATEMCRAVEKLQVEMPWAPNDDHSSWQADVGGKAHHIFLEAIPAGFSVNYKINGRRKALWDHSFNTKAKALKFLHTHVAKTALR